MTPIRKDAYEAHVRLLAGMEAEEARDLLQRVEELHGVNEADRLRADARAYWRSSQAARNEAFEHMSARTYGKRNNRGSH